MKRLATKLGFYFSVFVLVSPAVLVFLWMISLSFKNELDNTAFPPVFIPDPPTLKNYVDVFAQNNFALYLWNSILVTGGAVLIGLGSLATWIFLNVKHQELATDGPEDVPVHVG